MKLLRGFQPYPFNIRFNRALSTSTKNNNFFNFPFISNQPKDNLLTYNEEKIINFSCKQLFNVISDVQYYHQFLPFCQASPVHSKKHFIDQYHRELFILEADLKVGFFKFNETYTSKVTCYPYYLVRAENKDSKMFKQLTNEWRLIPYSPSNENQLSYNSPMTKIQFDITFEFNSPIYTNIAKNYFNEVSTTMMQSFQKRCELVYNKK